MCTCADKFCEISLENIIFLLCREQDSKQMSMRENDTMIKTLKTCQ